MTILIPLADGFEEIEAIAGIDVLRRAGLNVITAFLNEKEVIGSHDITIVADMSIDLISVDEIDGILIPGGMPGAKNIAEDKRMLDVIKGLNTKQNMIAAICAAPIALEAAGVIDGKMATSYPGFDKEMTSCIYKEDRVVIHGNIITARGPGVALEFAIAVVEYLVGKGKATELKKAMLADF